MNELLHKAARLLLEDASDRFDSCVVNGRGWACADCPKVEGKCPERAGYDERIATALQIQGMGK